MDELEQQIASLALSHSVGFYIQIDDGDIVAVNTTALAGQLAEDVKFLVADHDQARKKQVLEAINIKVERSSDDTDMKIIRERARIIGILEDVYGSKEKS